MKKVQLFFATAICFSTASIGQTNTSLKLPAGKTFQVENKLETSSSTDVQGQTMESNANVTSTYKIVVKNKTNDTYNLTNTLTRLALKMSMMGQDVNFNSDTASDMNGEFGSALKEYVNQPKDITIDQTGKVVSADTSDTSATGIAQRLNLAQTGYGTQLAFVALPATTKVGTSWTETTNSEGMSKVINYTIKAINGNIATVAFTGTDSVTTSMEQQGMQIATKTSGKVAGEEKVDLKTGVIQSASSTGDASGTVSAMGQEFPMTTKVTSTTTIKEL